MDNKTNLIKFINSVDFGIEIANDYYGGQNKYYMDDLKKFENARRDAVNLLQTLGRITDKELIEACDRAFSGRLRFENKKLEYIAGQFYNLEVPQAVLAVAEYIKGQRLNNN